MSLRNVAFFSAATKGIAQSQKNLASIKAAKAKKQQDKDLFDLQKKKVDLQIKELEVTGEKTAQDMKFQKAFVNDYFKNQKGRLEAEDQDIDIAESVETEKINQLGKIFNASAQDPDVQNFVKNGILSDSINVGISAGDSENILPSSVVSNVNPKVPRSSLVQNKNPFPFDATVKIGNVTLRNTRKQTDTRIFRDALKQFIAGEKTSGELFDEFGDRTKELQEFFSVRPDSDGLRVGQIKEFKNPETKRMEEFEYLGNGQWSAF